MKNIYSLIACCIVSIILLQYRISHSNIRSELPLKVTTWDALGYYMYLPSIFIYQDITELKWLPEIDKQYSLSGGDLYQAQKHNNGKSNTYEFYVQIPNHSAPLDLKIFISSTNGFIGKIEKIKVIYLTK